MIERKLGKKAKIKLEKKNKLDPVKSLASNNEIRKFTKKKFNTSLKDGVIKCKSRNILGSKEIFFYLELRFLFTNK